MRACLRSWFSRQFFNLANCRRFWHNSPTSRHVGNDAGVNGNVGSRRTQVEKMKGVREDERHVVYG